MKLYNQHVGELLTVSMSHRWPLQNERGVTLEIIENNSLVVLLEYRSGPRSRPFSVEGGTVKILTTQGNIGYMPAKFLALPQQGNNHE